MEEQKIKKRKKPKIAIEFYVKCKKCGKEITGTSQSQTLYNLNKHEEFCKGEKK